jgi:hypothetical protein
MKNLPRAVRACVVMALFTSGLLVLGFRSSTNAVRAKWSAYVIRTGDGQADIHFTADIPGGWSMYSQSMAGQDGVLATDIQFDPDPKYSVVGSPMEKGTPSSFYQSEVGMEVTTLAGKAEYVQHITFKESESFAIKCMIDYMLTREGEILPPDDEDFTITIQP